MPEFTRKRPIGWIIAAILLGMYLVIKLQGWVYARQAQELERQLAQLRPALSAIVLHEQMTKIRQACLELSGEIRQMGFEAGPLLERLSRQVPASVTLDTLEVDFTGRLKVQGRVWVGIRPVEAVLVPWAERFRADGRSRVRIQRLAPAGGDRRILQFEMQMEQGR